MPNRKPSEVALMIIVLLVRSGEKRGRISKKTLQLVSKRSVIRASFVVKLQSIMDDYGYIFTEIDGGGYGIMPSQSLRAAKAITVKNHCNDEVLRRQIHKGTGLKDEQKNSLMIEIMGGGGEHDDDADE
ncbi:hypothetical protein OPV09_27370 [Janthinobacterium sp. TB1-E2]|uniref:Uncharacterized protein n=1 Tax=Janthinobacterium aestuarii TaxID=2985511 RepID=A0ABZ2GLQ9_9BURK